MRKTTSSRRFLAAVLCVVMTLGLFGGTAFADDGRMIGISIQDSMYEIDPQNVTVSQGVDIVTTGEKGGIGVDIQSNNDPVTASISGGAIRVQDQSDTGFEAMGVQAASYPGGEISLNLNADVSVSTTSQNPDAAVYGVKLASNNYSAISLYITDKNGAKISLYHLPRSYATHFSAKQDGVDVSDQYADLWVFFLFDDAELAFDSETCDLYMVSIDGTIRYRNLGLPAEIGRLFYGTENIGYHDDSGIPTGVQSPVTITLYSSETDPGTTLVIEEIKESDQYGPDFCEDKSIYLDADGGVYIDPDENKTRVINIFDGTEYTTYTHTESQIDAILGGSITAETSGDATGLNIWSAAGPVTADLQPGLSISSQGEVAAGILAQGAINSAVVTGQDVTIQAVSPSVGRSEALGIYLLSAVSASKDTYTPEPKESSVTLTGNNSIIVRTMGTPSDTGYAAGIMCASTALGPALMPVEGVARVYYEGTIDASGTGMVGIQCMIPVGIPKIMGLQRAYVTMIGDVNLSDSDRDALYAETKNVAVASMYDMIADIFLRGNVTVTNGRDMAAGVSALGGTVIVDGDISLSGTDDLIGVYADRNGTVLVTGEIDAPTTVRIPEDESIAKPNNSRVYIWKESGPSTGKTGQIGYVIKVGEGLDAVPSGSTLFTAEREGRTYYGADASSVITITSSRDDIAVVDANGSAIPVEKTDSGFTFTMPDDCGVFVTHEGHKCSRYDGMVWSIDYSSAYAVFSCPGCGETVTVPAVVTREVTEGSDGKRAVVYTATAVYEGETYTDVITVTGQTGQTESPEEPVDNPAGPEDTDWIFTSLAAGRKFNPPKQGEQKGNVPAESPSPIPETPAEPEPSAEPELPAEPEPPVLPFTDVEPALADIVGYVYENGIMNGISDKLFDPYGTLTRGMVVTILYRIEGSPDVEYNGTFTDVPDGEWFTDGVEWAASKGIVNGYGNGKFGPTDEVTREQLAAILYRYAGFKGYDVSIDENTNFLSYNDVFDIAEYAKLPMFWAIENDMILDTDGDLRPAEAALRWEVAAAIQGFCEKVAK